MYNNLRCKATDAWPTFNNNPTTLAGGQWTVTIPLIAIKEMCPVIRTPFHGLTITIRKIFESWQTLIDFEDDVDIKNIVGGLEIVNLEIEAEGVFLDTGARAACANTDAPADVPFEVVPKTRRSNKTVVRVDYDFDRILTNVDSKSKIDFDLSSSIGNWVPNMTYMMITYRPKVPITNPHPITYMEFSAHGRLSVVYDHVDLEEINWIQCGLLAPRGAMTAQDTYSEFVYLFPFAKDFMNKYPTTWQSLLGYNSVILGVESNGPIPDGTFHFMVESLNVRRFGSGISALTHPT
jgi:hypothetical protein